MVESTGRDYSGTLRSKNGYQTALAYPRLRMRHISDQHVASALISQGPSGGRAKAAPKEPAPGRVSVGGPSVLGNSGVPAGLGWHAGGRGDDVEHFG